MIDVITPTGIAVHVKDAVSDVALDGAPELIGRLVQVLVDRGVIGAEELRRILPISYEVRK